MGFAGGIVFVVVVVLEGGTAVARCTNKNNTRYKML